MKIWYDEIRNKAESLPQHSFVIRPYDIYHLGRFTVGQEANLIEEVPDLRSLNITDEGYLFFVSYAEKDNHAFTAFSVMLRVDNGRFLSLGNVLINSWVSDEYLRYLHARCPSKINVERPRHMNAHDFKYAMATPFLEGSIDLQRDDNDCAFYTQDITLALIQCLKDPDFRNLMKQIFVVDHNETEANWKAFGQKSYRECLYKYLPQYFNCVDNEYLRKDQLEFSKLFLARRWTQGADFFNRMAVLEWPRLALPAVYNQLKTE